MGQTNKTILTIKITAKLAGDLQSKNPKLNLIVSQILCFESIALGVNSKYFVGG